MPEGGQGQEQGPEGGGGSGGGGGGGRPSDGVFDAALAPWPVRFYVFDGAVRQLLYASEPRQAALDPWELWAVVEEELSRRGVEGDSGGRQEGRQSDGGEHQAVQLCG